MNTNEILSRLDGVSKNGSGHKALCPGHDDTTPSLSITEAEDGRILLKCHAGCSFDEIVSALGVENSDLAPARTNGSANKIAYDYVDEVGTLLYQVVRFEPKSFRQRTPDGAGGWIWKLGSVRRVLYRLPEVITAVEQGDPVYICEGEKDAETLRKLGLVATTNSGGAEKWRDAYSNVLSGATIIILPDDDGPGRKHALVVAHSLTGIADSVRIIDLGLAKPQKDVTDWLGNGHTRQDLEKLVQNSPIWNPDKPTTYGAADTPSGESGAGKTKIILTDRYPHEIEDDLIECLRIANNEPFLFRRDARPVRVTEDECGQPRLEEVSESALDGVLTGLLECHRTSGSKSTPAEIPHRYIKRLLSNPNLPFPPVEAIVETPVFRPNGTMISPGYDRDTRLYYHPTPQFELSVNERPSSDDAAEALRILWKPFNDFPYADSASKANTVALILTPFVRPLLGTGSVPLASIDSPVKGTGKTHLVNAISLIATGRPAATMSQPETEAEMRKQITSVLLRGPSLVVIDNCKGRLASSSLEQCLTTSIWSDRILGKSQQVEIPNRATWIVTGNNLAIWGDLTRRAYNIRLDAKMHRPWMGRDFEIEDLPGWIVEHRGQLVSAALTIVRAWVVAERPTPEDVVKIGGFEQWSVTLSGILSFVSENNFLANLLAFYEEADDEDDDWETLLNAIHDYTGGAPFLIKNLAQALSGPASLELEAIIEALPVDVRDRHGSGKSISSSLGNFFKNRRDVRFGNRGWRIAAVGMAKRSTQWCVEVDDVGESGKPRLTPKAA